MQLSTSGIAGIQADLPGSTLQPQPATHQPAEQRSRPPTQLHSPRRGSGAGTAMSTARPASLSSCGHCPPSMPVGSRAAGESHAAAEGGSSRAARDSQGMANQRQVMQDVSARPQYNRGMMMHSPLPAGSHAGAQKQSDVRQQSGMAGSGDASTGAEAAKRQRTLVDDFDQDSLPAEVAEY